MNQSNDTLDFYDEDYLHFSSYTLGPERTDNEVAFIRQVLGIGKNDAVLDLGCGHGRIANGLAKHGARVTGIEILPLFLARARADAAAAGLAVDYRQADMRDAISAGPFDAAIIWFFAFGYHSEDDNRRVLQNVSNVLKPGGKLLLDQYNASALARAADHYTVLDLESSLLLQRPVCDLEAGRWGAERIVVRDGIIRRSRFTCRCYSPIELSCMLADAGFDTPNFFGDGFKKLELDSTRLIAATAKTANSRG
jgi:SAM-dependent methyltransferase